MNWKRLPFSKKLTFQQFLIALLLLLLFYSWFFFIVTLQNARGDEPHYLLITKSLLKDHDLNLKNNYKNYDYLSFYPYRYIDPHIISQGNNWYSTHNLLVSLIVLPGFWIMGVIGARLTIIIAYLILIYLVRSILKKELNEKLVNILSFLFALTPIIFAYSMQIFPDIFIALGITLTLRLTLYEKNTLGNCVLLGVIFGFMLWLHGKTFVLLPSILLILFFKKSKYHKLIPLVCFIVPLLVFFVLLLFINNIEINGLVLSPLQTRNMTSILKIPFFNIISSIFDQQSGLLLTGTLLIFGFFSMFDFRLIHENKPLFINIMLLVLPLIFINFFYEGWYGGWSPWGRYWVEVSPLLFIAFAKAISSNNLIYLKKVLVIITSLYFIWNLFTLFANFGYSLHDGKNVLLSSIDKTLSINISSFFPTFLDSYNFNLSIFLSLFYLIVLIFFYVRLRHIPKTGR